MLWGSRCLMSLGVALYILPPLFSAAVAAIMPLPVILNDAAMTGLRSMVIVVGAMALVLVVNTSWSRRILAVVLFAIVWSAIVAVVQQLIFFAMTPIGVPPLLMTTAVVAVSLTLVLGGFGVFHLLGRIRGATVPAFDLRTEVAGTCAQAHSRPAVAYHGSHLGIPGA